MVSSHANFTKWVRRSIQTHVGARELPSVSFMYGVQKYDVYDVSEFFPDVDKRRIRSRDVISGFAMHHDAVAFSGVDQNFNGHKTDEEFRRLKAIYDYHILQGWNGIGYHSVHGLENRIYVPRTDFLDVHRAHVSGTDPSGVIWNSRLIGCCFMGHYADKKAPGGNPIAIASDRPLAMAINGMSGFMQTVTNTLDRDMTLRPHKFYQKGGECPGDWTREDSWKDFAFSPESTTTPAPSPAPAPPPAPAPDSSGYIDAEDYQKVMVGTQAIINQAQSIQRILKGE